jgi:molybdopterin-containing oxidoreductase family iron-sulfur binding subunit
MLDGRHAHNAWLHELPDPVTKVTWDNYACLSPAAAARLGIEDGDLVRIELGKGASAKSLELPALIQPGQHDSVVAVALGYGRVDTERFARIGPRWVFGRTSVGADGRVGGNAAPLALLADGLIRFERSSARIVRTGEKHELASTQEHHSLSAPQNVAPRRAELRPIVQETTLAALVSGIEEHTAKLGHDTHPDLWPDDHPPTGHRWAMAIDLSACTGCSACVVACQAENNIPVVGKDEVRRKREMHWLRVDRYYADHGGGVDVAFQPMMCQHCDTAPCETVCPVLATVHSEEGLNQQIYNRCVGTRYCANNCPYKVRRFNWFDYPREDRLQNLVLNPDVTVRSRGVMEKCTFCVQRIQEAKIEARRKGERLADGAIRTACEQSCPAGAIIFGDLNDPGSRIAKLAASGRAYRVLEEFNFRPAVHYLKLVRNRQEGEEGEQNG